MIQRYIEQLRQRPKAVRAQAAFVFATAITSVFVLIWAFNVGDRLFVESSDPAIAQLQQKQRAEEELVVTPETNAASLFGQLKRGVAAVIFNHDGAPESVEEEKSNTIDIDALLANPPAQRDTDEQIVVPEPEERVILIGTSTNPTEYIE